VANGFAACLYEVNAVALVRMFAMLDEGFKVGAVRRRRK
jgi:hypothetical protein